ncbi:carbon monoxide dehydrogenase [Alsobacter metallidurans]|uniref:Carbon monoxide dehydrogenase n=1 Tax=Alsobacter metallidurans TaxID=340221 RepID=A0A917I3I3_9HYPH|nr:xanthine dehydrogenase family protein molybdopterin-binding subunit [Alsobacter metallidurans]GGH06300.1 carbon monoxide dehydrogenase [Alsobacter metallidurans]
MNKPTDPSDLSLMKFGIGQPVSRNEDPILVRGEGRYTDDVNVDGQLYAAFVRSPYAHGVLNGVDLSAALDMPGVVAAYTGADLVAAGYGTLPCIMVQKQRDGSAMVTPARPSLAVDKVRFVGDPVAFVVAETAAQARDAAEAVALDIDPLPAVATPEEADKPGAPTIYDEAPGNCALDYHFGPTEQVEAAFASAAHVTRLDIANNRIVVNSLEPRAALAQFSDGRYVLNVPTQGVFGFRNNLAGVLKVEPKDVHVITGHVGGSFGMKGSVFPEYVSLLHAAKTLGRPVKWTDARSDSFVSDHHGRDQNVHAELALDAKGKFLAVRISGHSNMGGYLSPVAPLMSTLNIHKNGIGTYTTPLMQVDTRCMFTNTAPIGAYRGAGRPEGNYFMERLIDQAAREMGIDPVSLRKRNQIKPSQMPYKTPVDTVYDSGDFTALLERAVEAADWKGFAQRKRDSRKRGLLRGRGIGCYLEVTAPPMNEMGGIHFEADGTVTIVTGTLDYGQGHWTPFAQVLTTKLGVPFDKIKLVQGDSDRLVAGGGTGGSKSIMASGAAIVGASEKVIEKGRIVASYALEAGVEDIEFANGRFAIAGTDRGIGVMELAAQLRNGGLQMPDDAPKTLDVDHVHRLSPSAYPNGCHIAEVEIDPDTGVTKVVRYVMVNDFGTVVNPLLVEGQLHGGVMQGIGQALMEFTEYDADGQLVTGSFMDYAMPRADDMPEFTFESRPTVATTNPLGAKGCGEAGCAGALPSVMNAINDALAEVGVTQMNMPATPKRVWEAIQQANSSAAA